MVRSMAGPATDANAQLQDVVLVEDEDAVQEQAATLVNDDPTSARPIASREDEALEDLERGVGVDRNR